MSAFSDLILSHSPIGYWRCDAANAAAGVTDSSGFGRNGTWAGNNIGAAQFGVPGLVAGDPSTAVRFINGSAYGNIPPAAWMAADPNVTYFCLFKADILAESTLPTRHQSSNAEFRWRLLADGSVAFHWLPFTVTLQTAAGVVNTTNRYLGAVTYVASTQTLYMRITNLDTGVVTQGSRTSARSITGTGGDLAWGWQNGGKQFQGTIDEVAMFPTNLTPADLAGLEAVAMAAPSSGPSIDFYDGAARQPATLLGYYDGAAVQPASLLGYYDGAAIQPLVGG